LVIVVIDVSMQRWRVKWRLQRLAQRRLSRRPKLLVKFLWSWWFI